MRACRSLSYALLVPLVAMASACPGPPPAAPAPPPSTSGLSISIPRAPVATGRRNSADAAASSGVVATPAVPMAVVVDRRELAADGGVFTIRDIPQRAQQVQVAWLGGAAGKVLSIRTPSAPLLGDRVRVHTEEDITVGTMINIDADNLHIATGDDVQPTPISRASVRDIRALDVDQEVRLKRPAAGGSAGLMELSYRVPQLSWSASYTVRATVKDGRVSTVISPELTIHNRTGHQFPEADVELVVGTGQEPLWRGRKALTESNVQVRSGQSEGTDQAANEISLTGRIEYVARLHDTIFAPPVKSSDDKAVKREPRVTRELLLPLPDGHPLADAPPGWARVRLSRTGRDDEHFEGPFTRDEASAPIGDSSARSRPQAMRVTLGPAHGLTVAHRQTTHTQASGTITRHRLQLSNSGKRAMTVRIVAPIVQARTGELLNTEPTPVRQQRDTLEFVVKVAAGEDEKVSYSLFYAQ